MQNDVTDPRDPGATVSPARPSDTPATTSRPPSVSPPTAAPRHAGRRPPHPLWLALAMALLFGLAFSIGAVAGRGTASSTTLAPSDTAIEETTIRVVQEVSPSVVKIQGRRIGSAGSVGSGEVLSTSGYIVTNSHVIHGFSSFTVQFADGRTIAAQLVGEAPSEDLAVLKITANNLTPITIGDSSGVRVGEFALAIGSPFGLEQSTTAGIISALNREVHEIVDGKRISITGLIQTSAPINPGNSGGALVNLRGELVGIPTLGAVDPVSGASANGIGFAISSNRMKVIVSQLTGGAVRFSH